MGLGIGQISILAFILAIAPLARQAVAEDPVKEAYYKTSLGDYSCTTGKPDCKVSLCAPVVQGGSVTVPLFNDEKIFAIEERVNGQLERRIISRRWSPVAKSFEWSSVKPSARIEKDKKDSRYFDDDQGVVSRFGQPLGTAEIETLTHLLTRPVNEVACNDYSLKAAYLDALKELAGSDLNRTSVLLGLVLRSLNISVPAPACNRPETAQFKSPKAPLKDPATLEQVEASVLSEAEAMRAFKKLAERKDIPFRYPEEGCFARAHEMAWSLEQEGIICAKAFVNGDLKVRTPNSPKGFVQWATHVAPVVWVKTPSGKVATILDPSMFDHPVSIDEWRQAMDQGKDVKLSYGPRFMMFGTDSRTLSDWSNWRAVSQRDIKYFSAILAARDEEWRRSASGK